MRLLCVTFALLATAALAQDDIASPGAPAVALPAVEVPAVVVPAVAATSTAEASGTDPADGAEAAASESASEDDAEPVATTAANGPRTMSGMSILGNEETPTSLVIVPWKSSRLGDGIGVSNALDDSPRALDRDVFTRELRYYELRAGGGE